MSRFYSAFAGTLVALAAVGVLAFPAEHVGDIQDTGLPLAGGEIGDDPSIGDCIVYDDNGAQGCARTTDAAPNDVYVTSQSAYSQASVNKTGGEMKIAAGIGSKAVAIDDYNNCGTDTVTVRIDAADSVLTEASEWTAATSNAATATSLASAIDALTGVSAVSSAANVFVTPDITTASIYLTEGDATCTTVANGVDGNIRFYSNLVLEDYNGAELLHFGGTAVTDVALKRSGAAFVIRKGDDSANADLYANGFYATNVIRAGATFAIYWTGRGAFYSSAAGKVAVTNVAGTQGIEFDTSTDSKLLIVDEAGADVLVDFYQLDLGGSALTSGGTDDYNLEIAQTLNDTGAAGGSDVYRGLKVDVTIADSSGWDNVYLVDVMQDSSSLFRVPEDGGLKAYDTSGNGFYWQEFHLDAVATSPGGSGATLTAWNTSSLGYLLDATNEYLYFSSEVHDDWEGDSDHVVEAFVCLNAAEAADDIIQAELISEYYGEHDDMDTPKTQTRTVDHDIVSDNAAGECHALIFVLDYDLADNVIEVEDQIKFRFRLDSVAGGTDVAAVRALYFNHKYRTPDPSQEAGTFPSEG
jgi:hypothetical protein